MLIKQLMNVLLIEIRAERSFEFNVNLMRDTEAFTDRRADADRAAGIVDQIRQDEASHVAYLQLFISELRPLHFKTADGVVEGKTFIDPVWAKIVAYGGARRRSRRPSARPRASLSRNLPEVEARRRDPARSAQPASAMEEAVA